MEPGPDLSQISPPHFQGLQMSLSLLSGDENNTDFLKLKRGSNEISCLAQFLVVAPELTTNQEQTLNKYDVEDLRGEQGGQGL